MLAWAKRGDNRLAIDPEINIHPHHEPRRAESKDMRPAAGEGVRGLRFLTYNIQVGIRTSRYRHYVTKGWKHVLPHEGRNHNLRRIADVVSDYDFVALQEIDAGSIRSGFINQVEYIADHAGFPYWYTQLNRDLGPFAQHGSGLLSRIAPDGMEDHRLPGAIPGRGAIVVRLPYADTSVLVVLLHLSLGARSRKLQLDYVKRLIDGESHVVVMGDMNSHLANLLFNSPLAETDLRPAENVLPTYPSWQPALALDHILVSPSLSIREYDVLDCRLSDHRPISVTVARAEQTAQQKATV
ncbi:MAG: endonuclease/exonuclease/phosphatase family protein [Gammaproteobacteria bacterium]|nr:endonuclease/exonuclease/phosphatase family protein [Gammaproteobacteria bacterium]